MTLENRGKKDKKRKLGKKDRVEKKRERERVNEIGAFPRSLLQSKAVVGC